MFYVSRRRQRTPIAEPCGLHAAGGMRTGAARLGITVALILTLAPVARSQNLQNGFAFHSPAPAGYSVVVLQPSRTEVSILGLVECPEFDGAKKVSEGIQAFLLSADGAAMKHYPREFSFRVTATLRKTLLDGPSETLFSRYDPQQFLLKLGFKLRIYHGLERRDIFPRSVKMIGMPADVPYDERVYRVIFDVDDLPVSDRMVLEILSPENHRLTHFSFGVL
jgi:hypothetical protein